MRIHFPGLNALRFYAALSVVIQHIRFSPSDWFGAPRLPDTVGRFFINGTDAVNLFFVLSGFLIMYLLLSERESTGDISVSRFYMRRILRIWPLYYLVIALVAFVVPLIVTNFHNPLTNGSLSALLLLFMGNFAFVLYFPYAPLEHIWSIAIEEQFYLVAPHLARMKISLAKLLFAFIAYFWLVWWFAAAWLPPIASSFLAYMRYDCIAIGGLFACALYYHSPILKWLYHPVAGYGSAAAVALMALFVQPTYDLFYTTATCILFGILILNVSTNPRFALKLDHPALEYMGKLSYSIYMYHPLLLLIFYTQLANRLDAEIYGVVIYPIMIASTLFLSWISYRYFEQPLLKLKDRYKPVSAS